MTIYVCHSRNYDFQNKLYKPLKESDLSSKHNFIFPHQDSSKPFESKKLLESKGCDLVLAEVSFPATGQGIELGWADAFSIPVLCIYKKDSQISGSLKVITSEFIKYIDSRDMVKKLISHIGGGSR